MPRASNEKKVEAERLFNKGIKLVDIAKKLGVPEGTVRSWKNRGKWEGKSSKKNKRNVAKDASEKNATLQKRKRGGQPGNQNAEKHGAYSKVYWDALDDEEQSMIDSMGDIAEEQLVMQLQMFSVRERRLMRNIKKYREIELENHGLSVKAVSKTKKVEDVTDIEGEAVFAGKYKKVTETSVTNTEAVMNSIMVLESELTKVQKAKTKAIEALARIRMENAKIEQETTGSATVDDWISAVIGEVGADEQE